MKLFLFCHKIHFQQNLMLIERSREHLSLIHNIRDTHTHTHSHIKTYSVLRIPSSLMLRVALVRNDVWEESSASIIRVRRIGKQGTTLAAIATDARREEIRNLEPPSSG
jgi:hypothetical protein